MKTIFFSIIITLVLGSLQAQPKLVEIRFYGYENPEVFKDTPYTSHRKKWKKDLCLELLQLPKREPQPEIPPTQQRII